MGGLDSRFKPYADALLELARRMNPAAYISSGKRSSSKQRELYRDYVTGRSRYPAAVPGTSKHERGLAVDLAGLSAGQLKKLGRVWRSWGGRWGGSFKGRKDPIHFEAA